MIINSTGINKSNLTDYLGFWTTKLREIYNNDFVIRKEGLVDNIATAGSLTCMALEDVMLYLAKQMNPYTAEGEFQDALYALVGLTRNYASFTVVTRTIEGTVGTVCDVGSVRFKNSATDDIFELNTAVTIGSDGKAVGSFTAIELGAIELEPEALLNIVDAPEGIVGVYYSEGNVTTVGNDYEDDSEFRLRWITTNSVRSGNTQGGMYAALLPLCNNSTRNLVITQNRTNSTVDNIPAHSMHIVLNSAENDTVIANTIFNNLMDGVGLYGDIDVVVKDLSDEDVTISFSRTDTIRIYFNVEVVVKSGFVLAQVRDSIKSAIVDNFDYAMGERVIANDFYQYINAIEGIDYVTALEISDDNNTWVQTLDMAYNEKGVVQSSDITVAEG